MVSPSLLSKRRTALGPDFFQKLDALLSETLVKGKVVKARGPIMDGTVVDEKIKHPNDVGLLNDARTWLVRTAQAMGRMVGKAYRTCSRTVGKVFLGFSKLKRKSRKTIRKAKKQMLQFVRRNIKQVKDAVERMQARGERIAQRVR
ncbi:MAG: DDE transposase, partial [Planctomycetota bacterium]